MALTAGGDVVSSMHIATRLPMRCRALRVAHLALIAQHRHVDALLTVHAAAKLCPHDRDLQNEVLVAAEVAAKRVRSSPDAAAAAARWGLTARGIEALRRGAVQRSAELAYDAWLVGDLAAWRRRSPDEHTARMMAAVGLARRTREKKQK